MPHAKPALNGADLHSVVVDDDPQICSLISRVLSDVGVSSMALSTIADLARVLADFQPKIIFLDVALGGSDAVDGIRILRALQFGGAVQLVSGKHPVLLDDIRAVGERSGLQMLEPLRKPFRSEHIRSVVTAVGTQVPGKVDHSPDRVLGETPGVIPAINLREALEKNWVTVEYQAKVSLCDAITVGAEALARVRHPKLGLVPPSGFIPGSDASSIFDLSVHMIERCFRDWDLFKAAGFNLRLAVNLQVQALTENRLVELLRESSPREKSWPGLILEVTEDQAIQSIDAVSEAATQLQIYGVDLAIDDFGSGFSSFARLKHFPFCELKLDRSYVQHCGRDTLNAGICRSIINLAHASGASCVAEGIESPDDYRAVKHMGCDLGQGFLFGRPASPENFRSTLSAPSNTEAPRAGRHPR